MMMLSKGPSVVQGTGGSAGGLPHKSNLTTPSFSPKTSLLQDSSVLIPAGEKLLPSLLQQIAKASVSGSPWTVPSCTSAFTPHNEQSITMTSTAHSPKSSVPISCKLDSTNLSTHMLEQQLATHLLERYSQQLSPSHHFTSPLTSKLFTSNTQTLLNSQLTTTNSLLGSHLAAPQFMGPASNQVGLNPHGHGNSLILPRFNSSLQLSPVNSPRNLGVKEFMKSEENNSRRLRWKEEHGRILISIWKEKYPQVRAAKKIKEKHAIWQEIGEEYNKYCLKYDWPPRSTEQVKIKVKNCIDEYKQTIKYNQEYKTCPYFQDIDDIFGMSDPEKAAELQKTISASPQSVNSDNAYWSGSSLPTQVKKRKLNISSLENTGKEESESRKSPKSSTITTATTPCSNRSPQADTTKDQQVYLLNLAANQSTEAQKSLPILPEARYNSGGPEQYKKKKVSSEEPRYDVKIGGCSVTSLDPESNIAIPQVSQLGDLIKQLHEREDKMVEVYHRIDLERRNANIMRERERYEAEFQLEKSRQVFLSNVIEKLISVIKDKSLLDQAETSKLFPALVPREPEVSVEVTGAD